jgi:FemAB-related protein (PEP-CTERM system-associated)
VIASAAAVVETVDVEVKRVEPAERLTEWSAAVDGARDGHVAHAPAWREAIGRAYGHQPLYLVGRGGDGRRGALPAFVVRRPLLGAVVSSMPFLDGGGPCGNSPEVADALALALVAEARRLGARAVEVRCARRLPFGAEPAQHKVNLVLSLPSDEAQLWRELDGRVRNQVRKAERSGLTVQIGGAELLPAFYPGFAARMRELGSPVHAPRFFAEIFAAFGGAARLALVRRGTNAIGGLVAIGWGQAVTVPWAACLREHAALCPNMLLYWEALRHACREGFRRFDFGRSTHGSGTYRFKRQWGAVEEPLFWYTLPLQGAAAATGRGRAAAAFVESWRRLPLPLTSRLGPRLRRYLTQ